MYTYSTRKGVQFAQELICHEYKASNIWLDHNKRKADLKKETTLSKFRASDAIVLISVHQTNIL